METTTCVSDFHEFLYVDSLKKVVEKADCLIASHTSGRT